MIPGASRVWIDGQAEAADGASVSVFDHGFLFGDSVYEVVRTAGVGFVRADEHYARLERSAASLRLELPLGRAALAAEVESVVRAAGYPESYVRIIVTRGAGEISLLPDSCSAPRRILIVSELRPFPGELYSQGLRVAIVGVTRNPRTATDPSVKSGNYLNSVLAMMEARERGADDGVMCNGSGHLAEGTTSNVFFVCDGALSTPSLSCGILSGVTRAAVLDDYAPRLGIQVREGDFAPGALADASEAFVTSTLKGVMPIGWVDGHRLPDPVPGPMTRRLMGAYAEELRSLSAKSSSASG